MTLHHRPDRQPTPHTRSGRVRLFLFACVWLMATGTHWDIVQVVAWSRMWTQNLQTESPLDALASTFSPDGMCSLCETVQAAKNDPSADATVLVQLAEKAPLLPLHLPLVGIVPPSASTGLRAGNHPCPDAFTLAPPVPPPRATA